LSDWPPHLRTLGPLGRSTTMSDASITAPGDDGSIEAILAMARPKERVVDLCLRGDLVAEHDVLERQIRDANTVVGERALGDGGTPRALAVRVQELERQMRAASRPFRFRALPRSKWDALRKRFESESDRTGYDMEALAGPLVAASCVSPAMTEEKLDELREVISHGQFQELFGAAWDVNTGAVDVPFSLIASATLATPE
jgi:hypothetical protein